MKIILEINNTDKAPVRKLFLEGIVEHTLRLVGWESLEDRVVEMSLAFVSGQEIRRMNRIYRKKNIVTDILSFAEYKKREDIEREKEKEVFLGELVVCYNDIKDYAHKKGIDQKEELANVVSHGILHLLGFRHGSQMWKIQQMVVDDINKK